MGRITQTGILEKTAQIFETMQSFELATHQDLTAQTKEVQFMEKVLNYLRQANQVIRQVKKQNIRLYVDSLRSRSFQTRSILESTGERGSSRKPLMRASHMQSGTQGNKKKAYFGRNTSYTPSRREPFLARRGHSHQKGIVSDTTKDLFYLF